MIKKIGRYEVIAEVGKGYEKFYRAYDPIFDREVRLTILDWMKSLYPKTFHKLLQNAKTITELVHPSIVPTFHYGEIDGDFYIVTKFMEGGSLAERLSQNPLSLNDVVKMLSRIALGLDEAHKKGYVHKSLNPRNILFDDANQSYVTDFFFSILPDLDTEEGFVFGIPVYMSPEQARGEKLDHRSDIYSLGIILFQMLSGKVPFQADTTFGTLIKHINEPRPDILDRNSRLPPIVRKFIEKAIAKEPKERFTSVGEMAAVLETINRHHNP